MPTDRSKYRNIHIYNASTGELLGGFYQKGSITETSLLDILKHILLVEDGKFDISIRHRETGIDLTPSSRPVAPGNYDIYSQGCIKLTDENWVARPTAFSLLSGWEHTFRDEVRKRDGGCVISGEGNEMAEYDMWDGYDAVHIFPLHCEDLWQLLGYGHCITNMDDDETTGVSKINSSQNGLLMSSSLRKRFDQYLFSINPNDNYKIITFQPNSWNIDGKILNPICRNRSNPNHVPDQLLRWHFRQSVLANMRGAGEPVFESDFPPGSDQMKTLYHEPLGKERLEAEVGLRLKYGVQR